MSYLFWKLCDQGRLWHWKNDVRSWFKAARNFFFTPDSNRTLIWHCLISLLKNGEHTWWKIINTWYWDSVGETFDRKPPLESSGFHNLPGPVSVNWPSCSRYRASSSTRCGCCSPLQAAPAQLLRWSSLGQAEAGLGDWWGWNSTSPETKR